MFANAYFFICLCLSSTLLRHSEVLSDMHTAENAVLSGDILKWKGGQRLLKTLTAQRVGKWQFKNMTVKVESDSKNIKCFVIRGLGTWFNNGIVDIIPLMHFQWKNIILKGSAYGVEPLCSGIMCTNDTRDRVSIDSSDRHLDRPAIDTRSTSRSTLGWHTVDISVDRLFIFVDTLSSGARY